METATGQGRANYDTGGGFRHDDGAEIIRELPVLKNLKQSPSEKPKTF